MASTMASAGKSSEAQRDAELMETKSRSAAQVCLRFRLADLSR